MVIWMLLTAAVLNAEAPVAPAKKQPEPVTLRVVAVKTLDDGRREVEILLTPDADVEIYANPPGEHLNPEVDVTLTAKDGSRLKSETVLPKPTRVIDQEGLSFYRRTGPTKVLVRFTPTIDDTLMLRCAYGAWNTRRECCLGFRKLETELKLTK